MRTDENAAPLLLISQKQTADFCQTLFILSCRRLIQKQQCRLLRQHCSQNYAQALSLAQCQRKIIGIFLQIHMLQQELQLLLRNRVVLPAQLLTHRIRQQHQIRLLPQVADFAQLLVYWLSCQQHASLLRLRQSAQKVHQRAFAGAVEAHDCGDLPLIKRELQLLQRRLLAAGICIIQVLRFQKRLLLLCRLCLHNSFYRLAFIAQHLHNSALVRRQLRKLQCAAQLYCLRFTQTQITATCHRLPGIGNKAVINNASFLHYSQT